AEPESTPGDADPERADEEPSDNEVLPPGECHCPLPLVPVNEAKGGQIDQSLKELQGPQITQGDVGEVAFERSHTGTYCGESVSAAPSSSCSARALQSGQTA